MISLLITSAVTIGAVWLCAVADTPPNRRNPWNRDGPQGLIGEPAEVTQATESIRGVMNDTATASHAEPVHDGPGNVPMYLEVRGLQSTSARDRPA